MSTDLESHPDQNTIPSRRTAVAISALAILASSLGIWPLRLDHFIDDAAFFFRYADHLAQGHGYVWNVGETPVWGASAPLWPLLLSAFMRVGISPESAAIFCGWMLTVASTVLLALAALRAVGISGALWTIVFCATNWRYCVGATQGMESPLAYFLIAAGCFSLCKNAHWMVIGLVAGLSMVHKIDFALFGPLLILATWIKSGKFPWRAALVAALIALAWYGFAWFHFGSILPNSFVTKLHATYGRMERSWFASVAFMEGSRGFVTLGSLLGMLVFWRRPYIIIPGLGLIAFLSLAYTLKPPPEPFDWYQAPIQPFLCFWAGCGLGRAFEILFASQKISLASKWAYQVFSFAAVAFAMLWQDYPISRGFVDFVTAIETDRFAAGNWINSHTSPDSELLVGYGNVAYHAHRFTYDSSFLNRRPPLMTTSQLIDNYHPDVVVSCPYRTKIAPQNFVALPGYKIAAIFDSAWRGKKANFYVVVMVREDLPR